MAFSTLPLLERVWCHFPNQSVFHLIPECFTTLAGLFYVAAVVCVVHDDSIYHPSSLHAGLFSFFLMQWEDSYKLNYAAHQGYYHYIHT